MLFVRPVTLYEVAVIPLWLTTVVEKDETVETCSPYDVAPLEALQVRVGLVEIPVAPFDGDASVGAAGGAIAVMKLHAAEYGLVPPAFEAFTRQ